ncbi:hypothetical protein [Sinorhizobium meliloti]|uniref:hypothetical protein n=1 Tax=Rhizobium meliloti TaxID=382 RepID=UPI00129698A1|nr:hypothetical protein [Sinorhizobium meliloti]MQX28965.1 hypothetical protein [Sinorhizobium meliloti]
MTDRPAIKPLEWKQGDIDTAYHFAQSSIGNYIITEYPVVGDDQLTVRLLGTSQYGVWFTTIDEAKAAAQSDYESRIPCLLDKPEAVEGKPVICIGHHTISQLMAGNAVEIDAAIMIPASDLSDPEPGEHQEVLDAIAAHNSGEEE